MRSRLPSIIYLVLTAIILLYSGVRFALWEKPVSRISFYSDSKINPSLQQFISSNVKQLKEIPEKALSSFPNIDRISIRNNQNGSADVWIQYKKIAGIWENGDKFYPLLDNGVPLMIEYPSRPTSGLVFKGTVPPNVSSIITMIAQFPELIKSIDYLEFIENRRWDITLQNHSKIMLPENNVKYALIYLKQSGMLNKSFNTLDLRDLNRQLVK